MRTTLLVLALSISGMSGSLQAARPHSSKAHASKPHSSRVRSSRAHASQNHRVLKGETASRIAQENGLTVAELMSFNPTLKHQQLTAGMTLRVTGAKHFRTLGVIGLPGRINRTPASSSEVAASAVPALPETPALGPASLVHLERVLPVDVRPDPPVRPEGPNRSAVAAADTPALASLRKVVPEETAEEIAPAPLATPPLGFEPADPRNLDLLWPVETRTVSSAWGPRMRSKTVKVKARKRKMRYRGSHKGVDLSAPKGADVFAAMDGQVVACGLHRQYGNFVVLDHGNGVVTLYAHHNRNFVKEGEIVRRGQKIAEVGRTGNATGPHLHFELRLEGLPQNPLPYLNEVEEIPAELVAQNQTAVAPSFIP